MRPKTDYVVVENIKGKKCLRVKTQAFSTR